MKKWICALLCLTLLLGLAACSQPANQQQAGGDAAPKDPEVFGILMLNMNAIINISYDKDGLVLAVTPENEIAEGIIKAFPAPLGSSCSKTVCDLITAIDQDAFAQEQNVILLKQVAASQSPTENFLEDIQLDAEKVAGNRSLVVAAVDTLTDEGYLSLDTAKEILAKQEGLADATLAGDPSAQDGRYWISATQADVVSQYSVDADLGTIEVLPNDPTEDEVGNFGEEFSDPTMGSTPEDTTLFEEFIGDPFINDADGIIFEEEATAEPTGESTEATEESTEAAA